MRGWLRRLACRVLHGHIMVVVGITRDSQGRASDCMYMCARCNQCEILSLINGEAQAPWDYER